MLAYINARLAEKTRVGFFPNAAIIKSMPKSAHKLKTRVSEVKKETLKQMLSLSTSAFGLVAALAWNELIKEFVSDYIKPFIGGSSGIFSLLIYAVVVTILAVVVTYNLSRIVKKA